MIEFGMYCAETGAHRECADEAQALQVWDNAPRTEGHWCLVLDHKVVAEEYQPAE